MPYPWPPAPAEIAASVAVLLGALQCVLARWRDLSPVTTAAAACAVILGLPSAPVGVAAGVAAAALLSAAGQTRGARAGVGRPALTGVVVAAAVVGAAGVGLGARAQPDLVEPLRAGVAGALGLLGVVVGALAVDRPRAARPPVRWVGEIRIEAPDDRS